MNEQYCRRIVFDNGLKQEMVVVGIIEDYDDCGTPKKKIITASTYPDGYIVTADKIKNNSPTNQKFDPEYKRK